MKKRKGRRQRKRGKGRRKRDERENKRQWERYKEASLIDKAKTFC